MRRAPVVASPTLAIVVAACFTPAGVGGPELHQGHAPDVGDDQPRAVASRLNPRRLLRRDRPECVWLLSPIAVLRSVSGSALASPYNSASRVQCCCLPADHPRLRLRRGRQARGAPRPQSRVATVAHCRVAECIRFCSGLAPHLRVSSAMPLPTCRSPTGSRRRRSRSGSRPLPPGCTRASRRSHVPAVGISEFALSSSVGSRCDCPKRILRLGAATTTGTTGTADPTRSPFTASLPVALPLAVAHWQLLSQRGRVLSSCLAVPQ